MEQKLITPKQAAAMCGVTTRTLANWEKAGKIGSVRTVGGHRRFSLVEVEALIGPVPLKCMVGRESKKGNKMENIMTITCTTVGQLRGVLDGLSDDAFIEDSFGETGIEITVCSDGKYEQSGKIVFSPA